MAHKVGIHTVNGIDYLYVSPIRPPNEVEGTRRLATAVSWGDPQTVAGVLLLMQVEAGGDLLWEAWDRITGDRLTWSKEPPAAIINGPEDDRVRDYSPRGKDVYSEGSIPEPE